MVGGRGGITVSARLRLLRCCIHYLFPAVAQISQRGDEFYFASRRRQNPPPSRRRSLSGVNRRSLLYAAPKCAGFIKPPGEKKKKKGGELSSHVRRRARQLMSACAPLPPSKEKDRGARKPPGVWRLEERGRVELRLKW